jgi:hypothetical protein
MDVTDLTTDSPRVTDSSASKLLSAFKGGDVVSFIDILSADRNGTTSEGVLDTLQHVKDFFGSCVSEANKKMKEAVKKEALAAAVSDSRAGCGSGDVIDMTSSTGTSTSSNVEAQTLLELTDTQFVEPRGRFKTTVSTTGLLLEGKSASTFIAWSNITHVAVIPAHQTTKKEGEDMMVLKLVPDSVKYNNKKLNSCLWNMQKSMKTPLTFTPAEGGEAMVGHESMIIQHIVKTQWHLGKVVYPRSDLFSTVSQSQPRPYLRCYKGTQEGAIYPLSCGVVFVKPTLFLPAEEIASITAGRGGGSGQTRYVDLKIELADDSEYEFTNIERDELPALQNYVKGYLEMRKAIEEEEKRLKRERGEVVEEEDNDDSDEDDDDFDPDASDSEDGEGSDSNDDSDDDSDDDDDDYDDEDAASMDEEENDGAETEDEGEDSGKSKPGKKGSSDKSFKKQKSLKKETKEEKVSQKKAKKIKSESADVDGVEEISAAEMMKAAYQSSFEVKNRVTIKGEKDEMEVVDITERNNTSFSSSVGIKRENDKMASGCKEDIVLVDEENLSNGSEGKKIKVEVTETL